MKSAPLIAMAMLLSSFTAHATNHLVRINEVMAGLNGDSSIQFVELASECNQKVWGHDNTQSGAMLTFHDAAGLETGRYTFASNPRDTVPTCFTSPVLIATEGFRQLTGVTPDFLMPPLVVPNAGKVCFRKNKNGAFNTTLCVAYGGTAYTGQTEEISGIPVASDLPIIDAISLTRVAEFGFGDLAAGSLSNSNAHFAFRKPTPASTSKSTAAAFENGEGEVSLAQKSDAEQGKALFMRETFAGNGRTCGTCHVPALGFGLTPEAVGVLPDDDALFVNEPNINTLTLIAPTLPSDFKHGSTLTGLARRQRGGALWNRRGLPSLWRRATGGNHLRCARCQRSATGCGRSAEHAQAQPELGRLPVVRAGQSRWPNPDQHRPARA